MKSSKPGRNEFDVDTSVYPLEAVQSACYRFIDRAYLRVSRAGTARARVSIKPKGREDGLETIRDEFHNELLHQTLRLRVSRSNQKIREFIVTKALVSAQPAASSAQAEAGCPECLQPQAPPSPAAGREETAPADPELEAEIEKLLAEIEKDGGDGDPLKVAVPWEEKHGASGRGDPSR